MLVLSWFEEVKFKAMESVSLVEEMTDVEMLYILMSEPIDESEFGSRFVDPSSLSPYSDATRSKGNSTKTPRPMNCFMVWLKFHRSRLARNIEKINHAELHKKLGPIWKTLSAAERKPFVEEADRLLAFHKMEFPGYKFRRVRKLKITDEPSSSKGEY